jgi:hypothetical protein
MQSKSLVWLGFFIGSTIGSFIPMLWGADPFSFYSILLGGAGGVAGIYIFYKMSR